MSLANHGELSKVSGTVPNRSMEALIVAETVSSVPDRGGRAETVVILRARRSADDAPDNRSSVATTTIATAALRPAATPQGSEVDPPIRA